MDAMAQYALIEYEVQTKHISDLIWELQGVIVKIYDRQTVYDHFQYPELLQQAKYRGEDGKRWLVEERLRHEKLIKQGITFK